MHCIFVNKKGISIVGAVFTLIILGLFGATIVTLVSTEHEMRSGQIAKEWAFYGAQAGLEYAIKEIDIGGEPVVTDMMFGKGSFSIGVVYDGAGQRNITSTGSSGTAKRDFRIIYDSFGGDCIAIDYTGAALTDGGRRLGGIVLQKVCNDAVTIDKIFISWNVDGGEKANQVWISDTMVWEDELGYGSGSILDISNVTISDSANHPINSIVFSQSMSGKTFMLKLIMSDTSFKNVSFLPAS